MLDALWTWLLPAACGLAAGRLLRPMAAGWAFDALILLLCALLMRALLAESDFAVTALLNPYALTAGFALGQCLRSLSRPRHAATHKVAEDEAPPLRSEVDRSVQHRTLARHPNATQRQQQGHGHDRKA